MGKLCGYCNKDISNRHPNSKYCNVTCRERSYGKLVVDEHNIIECKLCTYICKSNITQHLKYKHNLSIDEYKKSYNVKNEDCFGGKYLELCSEKIEGVRNPAYNHCGKYSPFSKNFIYYTPNYIQQVKDKVKETKTKNNSHPTQISYYISRGFDIVEAKKLLRIRQATNKLERFIERHGIEEGTRKWNERQINWQKTLQSKPQEELDDINRRKLFNGRSVSKAELELSKILKDTVSQFSLKVNKKNYLYDLQYKNKIIEYYGDYWHCNPLKYDLEYYHAYKKKTITEVWKFDFDKVNFAISQGYSVLIIWETDYKKNYTNTINKCMEFLYNE